MTKAELEAKNKELEMENEILKDMIKDIQQRLEKCEDKYQYSAKNWDVLHDTLTEIKFVAGSFENSLRWSKESGYVIHFAD